MTLPDEFRINHRAASESLLAAASTDATLAQVRHELEKATWFEKQAMENVSTPRQKALAVGLLYTVDVMSAVAEAEFPS